MPCSNLDLRAGIYPERDFMNEEINQPIRGEVTVFKTDKVTGDKLVGVGFRVFDTDGNVVEIKYER